MSRPDWDCPVCSQPNGAEDAECISCGCPYECSPGEFAQRKEAYDNPPLAEALPNSEVPTPPTNVEPKVPSSRYLGLFPSIPTLYFSILVFAAVYFVILAVAMPLAIVFKPDTTSSVCYGAIIGAAVAVGEYWKRCNMLPSLRKEKWAMTWSCLGVTLVVDLLALVLGVDIWNVKIPSTVFFQKVGHVFALWLSFGTNWLVSTKVPSQSAGARHAP